MTRPIALLVLLALAGCGLTPADLGITGPGSGKSPVASHATDMEDDPDAVNQPPGLPVDFGARYAPSMGPLDRARDDQDHFYGYN